MNAADPFERMAERAYRMTAPDAGELLTLQLAAWVREAHDNRTLNIPPLLETLDDVVAQLRDPALSIWGYREQGRLIATARTSPISGATAFLGRLGVVPDRIGQGLGSAMLRFTESRLASSVHRIELITGRFSLGNHAFYERHGYRTVGRDDAQGIVRMVKNR